MGCKTLTAAFGAQGIDGGLQPLSLQMVCIRHGRRLYPTAVGRYVVECAQKILDEQNRMLLTMKDVTGSNRKRIRLATAPNRGATIYSKIYNPFSRRYPDIALSLCSRKPDSSQSLRFESDDVLLVDSMMHQAVGVGLVSKAHVFPCEELVYRPLDPPVRQTLHLRYPLGHTLTEPEYYLAGLLAEERLVDPRYQPADSPFVAQLLENVRAAALPAKNKNTAHGAVGTALQTVQEVNLDTKVLEYLIAIVEEQSLSRAAERFFLAQPALSRHLRSVEAMVGMPLFSREHNRLHPTSAGTIFVNNTRNILRIENEMFAHTQSYYAGRGGHLYLSCDPLPQDFVPHPQLLAEQGSTLRVEQDALFQETFSATPAAACEAVSSILRQLANLGIADSILPLNLLERSQHLRCAAFDPPKPLYLLLGSHIGRTLPTVTKELDQLIRSALSDVLELPKRA